jgi:hypothetical protein
VVYAFALEHDITQVGLYVAAACCRSSSLVQHVPQHPAPPGGIVITASRDASESTIIAFHTTLGNALRLYGQPWGCTTAATACMVARTVCDRLKHRPRRSSTKEQEKGLTFFSCFFSLLSLRSFRVCSLHAQEGPLTALVLFLRTEQPVRCKGCIIVRIIRGGGEGEKSLFLFFSCA